MSPRPAAIRQAQALGLLTSEEWRITAWRNAPNTVRIVSPEWRTWLCMRDRKRASADHPRVAEWGGEQEAMTCVEEAMQICPDVWTSQDHGLACMVGKRQGFSPRCRVIYDKVAWAIHRGAVER